MGSVLRARGSSAPTTVRRGPAARSGAALTMPGLFFWNTHAQTRSRAHTLSRHHTFEGRSFLFLERLAEKQRVSFIYIVCEPDSHPRRTKLRLRAKRSDFFDWRIGEGGTHTITCEKTPVLSPPVFDFLSVFFFFLSCDLFPAVPKPGTRDRARAQRMKEN